MGLKDFYLNLNLTELDYEGLYKLGEGLVGEKKVEKGKLALAGNSIEAYSEEFYIFR